MSGAWERNPADVLIAIPISGAENTFYEWSDNTAEFLKALPQGLKVIRQRFPEPCIDISRDKAVQMAIQSGAKWLFFLDSDVIVPPDTLERLIAWNKDVVGGLYVRRHNPPFNEMLRFNPNGPGLKPIMDGEFADGDLIECDAIATGCMLIKTEVFERLRPFQITIDGQPARPQFFLWTEYRLPGGSSEDFSFCIRARQQGIQIFCDTSIKCKHAGPIKFIPSGNNTIGFEFMGETRW